MRLHTCMVIIGIDPGLKGGISILDFEKNDLTVFRMPTEEVPVKGKKKGTVRDVYDIPGVFSALRECDAAYMEQVGAMPHQGVSSVWRFGEGYGLLKSAVYARTGSLARLVIPRKWKGHFLLSDDKNLSRERAMELFPLAAPMWKKKRSRILDEGVTESSLIAAYGAMVDFGIPKEKLSSLVTSSVLI